MKKTFLLFITLLTAFVFSSTFIKVEALSTYSVTVTSYFDSSNHPSTVLTGKSYASKISLSTSLSTLEEYSFDFWVVNDVVRKDLSLSHEFVVTGNMDVVGVFSKSTEHAILFMDSNGELIDTVYTVNNGTVAPITNVSGYTKPNYVVDTSNTWDKSLTNISESDTRILQYKIDTESSFALSVIEGSSITTPNGLEGKYIFNTPVTVQANTPRTGEKFSHWEINGQSVSFNSTHTLSVVEDTAITAVYVPEAAPLTSLPLVSIRDVVLRTSQKSYISQMYIPVGHVLVDYGFLRSTTEVLDLPFDDLYRVRMDKYFGTTKEYLATFPTDTLAIKAYMVTEYDSTLYYTYSEQINYGFSGEGTLENPFVVTSASQLQLINDNLSASYILTADIDLTSYTYPDGGLGWKPLGDSTVRFTGNFDGQGHYIKGLMINRPDTDNVGLFGHIGASDTATPTLIKNIILIDVDITGNRGTGSLVGRVTGNASTLIENSGVINGTVRGTGATGGLVGSNNSFTITGAADRNPVINKSFSVNVIVRGENRDLVREYEKFGGLAGCSQKGTVKNSYSQSAVIVDELTEPAIRVGGLVGCNIYRGFLTDSYSASSVTFTTSSPVGALIGRTDSQSGSYSPIQDAYWDSTINGTLPGVGEGTPAVGAIVLGLSTSNMQGTLAQTNMTAFDWTSTWQTTTEYPVLQGTSRFVNFQLYAQGQITFAEIDN